MKNTLFLDAEFRPELLENEEASEQEMRNAVFLRFRTSSASNQRLQIFVKSVQYEVALDSSTAYNFHLIGLYWANDGVTSIRIVNAAGASDYVYITFPAIVQTDAALQPVDGEVASYYMQGKEDIAQDIRSETIAKTNGRDYYVSHLTKIIEFVFGSRSANISGLLTFTVTMTVSGVDGEADATFRIRKNRIFDDIFIPVHTVKNRKYIITICYPVTGITATQRNQVDVYLDLGGAGTAEILQGHAIATLTGASLAASNEFTGELEVLEFAAPVEVGARIDVPVPTEGITINKQVPIGANVQETIPIPGITETPVSYIYIDHARLISNYSPSGPRVLENSEDVRVLEGSDDIRVTEERI